jgi:hypothetical protein
MRTATLLCGGVAALVLAGCGRSRPTEPTEPVPERPLTWKRVATPDGSCSAEFPDQWHRKETIAPDVSSGLEAGPDDIGTFFALSVFDAPLQWAPFSDEGLLDSFRDRRLRDFGKEPPAERKIVVGGCSGWECEYRPGPNNVGNVKVKLFTQAGMVYQIAAITSVSEQYGDAAQRFMDSFRFEKTKP